MDKAVVASVVLGISSSVLLGLLILQVFSASRRPVLLRSVAIVVLGDVGRSPRMMYHAESFASNGFTTYIIGNKGTRPIPSLLSLPRVRFCYLPDPPRTIPGTPFLLSAPRKVASQIFSILEALLVRVPNPPEFIIVQNPPSIPTLALVWLVGWLRGSKVIIDWHNLGYSILALKLGERHPLVRIAEWFEGFFGRSAYAHLFVTRAMRDQLISKWSLRGKKIVLHDRPPAHFHRASESEMHELFLRLLSPSNSPSDPAFSNLSSPILNNWLPSYDPPQSTPFTHILPHRSLTSSESQPYLAQRTDRPALVVSSTSWTPDEDFGVLLAALSAYDKKAKISEGRLPKVLMIVTGKGPDRAKWLKEVDALQGNKVDEKDKWTHVRLLSMWLEAADYPLLLGSADLGISLHSSSSGIDLPMKVVDMFGCGLPVCALNFACLDELVKDGVNGLVFNNADQLATQLESLLTNFPTSPALSSLRTSLELDKHTDAGMHSPRSPRFDEPSSLVEPQEHGEEGKEGEWEWCTWAQNWDRVMKPVLLSDLSVDRE